MSASEPSGSPYRAPDAAVAPPRLLPRIFPISTMRYYLFLGPHRDLHPRPARRRHGRVHELLAGLLRRAARCSRGSSARVVTYFYGPEGKHGANYMQTAAASVASMAGHGRGHPGDGVARPPRARDVEAHPLLPLRRHVRHRRGHALHADPRRQDAAHVPLGPRGRQHPPRAHRREAAPAQRRPALHRAWASASRVPTLHATKARGPSPSVALARRACGFSTSTFGAADDRRRAHRRAGDDLRGRPRRLTPWFRANGLARARTSPSASSRSSSRWG